MICLSDKSVNNHPKQTVNHHCLDTCRAPTKYAILNNDWQLNQHPATRAQVPSFTMALSKLQIATSLRSPH